VQAGKLATYEDLLAMGDERRVEIIAGAVITSPPPLFRHGRAQNVVGSVIGDPYDHGRGGPGGWWIVSEVEVRLSTHDIVRPDVTGWRRERLAHPSDSGPVDTVPDWICEVISRSNAAHDRVRKRNLYARYAVPYYWLLDPLERTLEALRLEADSNTWAEVGSYGDGSIARIAPFEDIEIDVSRFFPPAAPDASP